MDVLDFTIDFFNEMRINVYKIRHKFQWDDMYDNQLRGSLLKSRNNLAETLSGIINTGLSKGVICMVTDELACNYIIIYDKRRDLHLLAGPFAYKTPSSYDISYHIEKGKIKEAQGDFLKKYYLTIPVINDSFMLLGFLTSLARSLDLKKTDPQMFTLTADESMELESANKLSNTEKSMAIIIDRYEKEQKLMDAISRGDQKAIERYAEVNFNLEKRLNDTLRDEKNYMIIFNTLCRKAAQDGNVHPIFLDDISSKFAGKIERARSNEDFSKLKKDMLKKYVQLVINHNTRSYSKIVADAITLLDVYYTTDISLSSIATDLSVSKSYIATIFKKETGVTVTQYLTSKRMKRAAHLLETTKETIQNISFSCGYSDLNYFIRCFKKYFGITPGEYRKSNI